MSKTSLFRTFLIDLRHENPVLKIEMLRQSTLQNNIHMQCHAHVKSYTKGSHTNSLLYKSADRLLEHEGEEAVTFIDFDI